MICDLSWDCDSYSLALWLVFTKIRKDVFSFEQIFVFLVIRISSCLIFAQGQYTFTIFYNVDQIQQVWRFVKVSNAILESLMQITPILLAASFGHFPLRPINGGPSLMVCSKMSAQCLTEEGEQFLNGNLVKVSLCGDRMGQVVVLVAN